MGDDRRGMSVEDARRFYQERHGRGAAAGETAVRTATSHYGAQTSAAHMGGAQTEVVAASGVEVGRDMSRGQRHADPHYHQWREAQMDALDRDYDAFRAQHRGDPAHAFSAWRSVREGGATTTVADAARTGATDADRDLALGERPDQGSAGPHILDRSFGGTYDD